VSGDEYLGRTLGRYTIEASIGSGGFATVYRATDTALERPVALKVLDPKAHQNPTVARRFVNEGRSVARLDHPAIVPVYDVGETDGLLWMAMRLVQGPTLDDALSQQRRFTGTELIAIVDRIAGALDHAHTQGIVHRDVKPSNILLEGGDPARAWLADFGIAATARTAGRYTTGTLGTAAYMAPEQARPGDVGPPADVYSLGCVVYVLVAGRAPFPGDDHVGLLMAHATEPVPPLGHEALDRVLGRMLAKAPGDRPATASALADELRPVLVDAAAPDGYEADVATALGVTATYRAAVAEIEHHHTVPYGSHVMPAEPAAPAGAGPAAGAPTGAGYGAPAGGPPGGYPAPPGGGQGPSGGPPAPAGPPGPAPGGIPRDPTLVGRAKRRARGRLAIGGAVLTVGLAAGAVALLADGGSSGGNRQCDAAGICFELPDGWTVGDVEPGEGTFERDGTVVVIYRHQPDEGIGDIAQALVENNVCSDPVSLEVGGTAGSRCDDPAGIDAQALVATVAGDRVWTVSFGPDLAASEIEAVIDGISFETATP
jgi:eukaryotic-like serine/threonine-protein kinase